MRLDHITDGGSLGRWAAEDGGMDSAQLLADLRRMISIELNPLFKIHDLVVVERLPRTASNKLMRRELRRRYDES